MSKILSREDAVRAFLDGKELEMNYKGYNGNPTGWVPLTCKGNFWEIIAWHSFGLRIAVPKAAFKEGEFAYLVSYDDAKGGRRYAGAFSPNPGAMFVKVINVIDYNDAREGWAYEVVDDTATPQTVHERDLRKASEVAPILIDE